MAIRIHIAPHPESLVAMLCERLATSPSEVFSIEMVAVPSRGIERWLTQRIASGVAEAGAGDGICANVEFPSPHDVVERALGSVPELAASHAAWEGTALTAHLLETIDTHLDEPWMSLLSRHLDEEKGGSQRHRLSASAKLARLFTRYARRRPRMIRAWQQGHDVDAGGDQLTGETVWQARLWRATRNRVGIPSLPELLPEALGPIETGEASVDLPDRLFVYGLTTADPLDLQVLVALGATRQIDLHILHPSPALWEAAAGTLVPAVLPERSDDPSGHMANHPLLSAWGRDSRELQTVLASAGLTGTPVPVDEPRNTLLGRLQRDIRLNQAPVFDAEGAASVEDGVDRSVQVHICHGSRRQAEVLRDAVLHLLADNPDLEPRDVVIMTPDLSTFAPLLEAAFPAGGGGDLPDLRLRIADRSPAVTNPLVGFTDRLLEVAGGRLEAGAIRELVDLPAVQQRFGFDTDTAGAIVALIDDLHIAWGVDTDHRIEWGVDSPIRTWRRGLDRALTGVFYADHPALSVGGLAPLEGMEGQEATPTGLLAAVMDRILAIREEIEAPRPLSEWASVIARSVRMLAAPAWGEEWQLDQLERLLGETFPLPQPGAADPAVTLDEARQAISSWTEDRPSPLHFRSGDITVCTLVPMRSVPYRVVALLGMDETRFPRRSSLDGDDLLADHEVVGDSEPASQDRQLLLDAVMAAGEHLLVTYSGGDELTNAEVPPSVPVAELVDTLTDMIGEKAMKRVRTRHPLQSFSGANFTPFALGMPGPWGFDAAQHAGARAIHRRQRSDAPAEPKWPVPEEDDAVRLKDLIVFLRSPTRRFMRARLGFTIPERGDLPDDTLPSDLNPLEMWSITDRILHGLIGGHDLQGLVERERGSDSLPPGTLGDDDLEKAAASARVLWEAAEAHSYDPRQHQPYAGTVVTDRGTVEGTVNADPNQGHVATVTPSRLRGAHRLDAWVKILFLTAMEPETPWKGLLLGKRQSSGKPGSILIGPLRGDATQRRQTALGHLGDLLDLYREGHRRPLPLPCDVSYEWQRTLGLGGRGKAWRKAKRVFEDFGHADDPAHRLLLPHLPDFEALGNDEDFLTFCARLWIPILTMTSEKNL